MKNFNILEWDSDFFDFKVARIVGDVNINRLGDILEDLKERDVKLVYWPKDTDEELSAELLAARNGILVDKKLTFSKPLDTEKILNLPSHKGISEYPVAEPDQNLLDLAITSGRYSRFKRDPKIGTQKFKELYHLWIRNSTLRKFAKTVLVYREEGDIMGMVTLGEKNGRGSIGLLAVAAAMRGKGIGLHLLEAADKWFLENGYTEVEVVTQAENNASIFYQKLGFTILRKSYYYHFWL